MSHHSRGKGGWPKIPNDKRKRAVRKIMAKYGSRFSKKQEDE